MLVHTMVEEFHKHCKRQNVGATTKTNSKTFWRPVCLKHSHLNNFVIPFECKLESSTTTWSAGLTHCIVEIHFWRSILGLSSWLGTPSLVLYSIILCKICPNGIVHPFGVLLSVLHHGDEFCNSVFLFFLFFLQAPLHAF